MSRASDLLALVNLNGKASELAARLNSYPWDSEVDLVALSPSHFRQALTRFVDGQIPAEEIELWANALEGREDVGFLPPHEELCRAALYELANPSLTQPLSVAVAESWINRLPNEH